MNVDEETEIDEAPNVKVMKNITRPMDGEVKEKKKNIPPKSSLKNTKIMKTKTPQRTLVTKKKNVEVKYVKKKSLNRNLVQSSDSETDAEANVEDTLSTIKRKVIRKRIPVNVVIAPLDNVSCHSKTSVKK